MPIGALPDSDEASCDDALRLENQLSFAIYSNANKLSRLFRPLLEPFGLTFPQYLALLALWERAPCTVTELSRTLNLEPNTLTPLLKRLEGIGYVTRERDLADERRVRIGLTPKGKAFRAEAAAIRARVVREVAVPEAEASRLRSSLQTLARRIDHAAGNQASWRHSAGAPERPAENQDEHQTKDRHEQELQSVRDVEVHEKIDCSKDDQQPDQQKTLHATSRQ